MEIMHEHVRRRDEEMASEGSADGASDSGSSNQSFK